MLQYIIDLEWGSISQENLLFTDISTDTSKNDYFTKVLKIIFFLNFRVGGYIAKIQSCILPSRIKYIWATEVALHTKKG